MIKKSKQRDRAPSIISVSQMDGNSSYYIDCNGPHGQSVACYLNERDLVYHISGFQSEYRPATVEFDDSVPRNILESWAMSN